MQKYSCESEILSVVSAFENGTIRRENWGHAEHLTVALYYLSNNDYETALVKMRDGFLIFCGRLKLICPLRCRITKL